MENLSSPLSPAQAFAETFRSVVPLMSALEALPAELQLEVFRLPLLDAEMSEWSVASWNSILKTLPLVSKPLRMKHYLDSSRNDLELTPIF